MCIYIYIYIISETDFMKPLRTFFTDIIYIYIKDCFHEAAKKVLNAKIRHQTYAAK